MLSNIPFFRDLDQQQQQQSVTTEEDHTGDDRRSVLTVFGPYLLQSMLLSSTNPVGVPESLEAIEDPDATASNDGLESLQLQDEDQVPWQYGAALVGVFAVALVLLVQLNDMGIDIRYTIAAAFIGASVSYGLAIVQARTGNNMAMPAGALTQLLFGVLSDSIATNAVGSAVTVMSGSQCITTLNSLRMGLWMGLKPKLIFMIQFYGTVIGALAEAVVYRDIMDRVFGCCDAKGYTAGETLPASGCGCQIELGKDGWVDIGGKAVSTMALVFTNLQQALDDNPAFKAWVIALAGIVVVWTPLRRLIPPHIRKYTPDLVLWGLGSAAPQNAWYIFTVTLVYWMWKLVKAKFPRWYEHTNFFLTSAVIMGSGFSGFLVLGFPGDYQVDLGYTYGDGCNVPPNMPGI